MATEPDLYEEAGQAWGVDPALLHAVTFHESGDKDAAHGTSGEIGRAQFMPATAREMGITDRSDPVQSVFGAAKLLRQHLDATNGNVPAALLRYNGGGNKAYPSYVLQHLPRFTNARGQAQAQSDTSSTDDPFSAAFGGGTPATAAPSSATPSSAAAGPSSAATPAPAGDDGGDAFSAAFAAPSQPPAVAAAAPMQDKFGPLASDAASAALDAEQKVSAAKSADQGIREALAPDSGSTYGTMLPVAVDNATGQPRIALPTFARDIAQGAYELSQGPATGTVTPAGTNALFAAATGGMGRSAASGTAEAIGNRLLPPGSAALGRNETPDLLGADLRAAPNNLIPSSVGQVAPNKLIPPAPEPPAAAAQSPQAASVPGATANMSPAQAEQFRLANPRTTANGHDPTGYVPGVKPTLAEVTGKVEDANDQRFLANQPDTKEAFRRVQTANNDARVEYYNEAAGDRQTLANAVAARDAQAERDLSAAWGGKTAADAHPVVQQIDAILAGPAGKETAVDKALSQVKTKLFDGKGNLETDPEILYGVRKEVANLLGKNAQQEQPTLRNAARQLSALKDTLDGQIEVAAPGYQQYLANYSAASRPIDSMELLQDALPSLQVGSDKKFTYAGFNRLMRGIVDARQSPGTNPAKSLDEPAMERLWNIYSDLHRTQQAQDVGGTSGSSTVPWLSQAAKLGAEGIGHLAVGVASGGNPVANMLLRGAVSTVKTARGNAQRSARVNTLLDGTGYRP